MPYLYVPDIAHLLELEDPSLGMQPLAQPSPGLRAPWWQAMIGALGSIWVCTDFEFWHQLHNYSNIPCFLIENILVLHPSLPQPNILPHLSLAPM